MAHVYRDLYSPNGDACGGLYGMVVFLRNFLVKHPHSMVLAAFDAGVPKFRKRLVPSYKSKRAERRENDPEAKAFYESLISQVERVPELFRALGIHLARCKGYEADDVIGALTLRRYYKYPRTILSEDKDLIQLVGGGCRQYRTCVRQMVTTCPTHYVLRRALEGDSSDSIPGVPDVGPVRAGKILSFCGSDDLDMFFAGLNAADRYQVAVMEHANQVRDTIKATDLRRTAKRVNKRVKIEKSELSKKGFKDFCRSYNFRIFLQSPTFYITPFERSGAFMRGALEKESRETT